MLECPHPVRLAATTVAVVAVVDDEDEDEVLAIPGVIGIIPSKVVPMIALLPGSWATIVGIDSVLVAPCVLLISASISLSGNASRRYNSA